MKAMMPSVHGTALLKRKDEHERAQYDDLQVYEESAFLEAAAGKTRKHVRAVELSEIGQLLDSKKSRIRP